MGSPVLTGSRRHQLHRDAPRPAPRELPHSPDCAQHHRLCTRVASIHLATLVKCFFSRVDQLIAVTAVLTLSIDMSYLPVSESQSRALLGLGSQSLRSRLWPPMTSAAGPSRIGIRRRWDKHIVARRSLQWVLLLLCADLGRPSLEPQRDIRRAPCGPRSHASGQVGRYSDLSCFHLAPI